RGRHQHHRTAGRRLGEKIMGNRILAIGAACLAFAMTAPAAAQGRAAAEASVEVAAIPGVISSDAEWGTHWEGPMIVDGMAAAKDGSLLFAQAQSNSVISVWPDGRWWVAYPFVAGAGEVSFGRDGN